MGQVSHMTLSTASLFWGAEPGGPEMWASFALQSFQILGLGRQCDLWSQIDTRSESQLCCSNWPTSLGQWSFAYHKGYGELSIQDGTGTQ